MMNHLVQKGLFRSIELELKENCLSIKDKSLTESVEYEVSYEEISQRTIYNSKVPDFLKYLIYLFGILPVFSFFRGSIEYTILLVAIEGILIFFSYKWQNKTI